VIGVAASCTTLGTIIGSAVARGIAVAPGMRCTLRTTTLGSAAGVLSALAVGALILPLPRRPAMQSLRQAIRVLPPLGSIEAVPLGEFATVRGHTL
jgi:hypothetical protein